MNPEDKKVILALGLIAVLMLLILVLELSSGVKS
jgi:hypothetical protein